MEEEGHIQGRDQVDAEKGVLADMPSGESSDREEHDRSPDDGTKPTTFSDKLASYVKRFERQLVHYNLEARGIQRVGLDERIKLSWRAYAQVFVMWTSINLAANNITLGMLAPAVYGLSFKDSCLCAVFGCILGSLPVAWIATFGPLTGHRTLVS